MSTKVDLNCYHEYDNPRIVEDGQEVYELVNFNPEENDKYVQEGTK